MKKEKLNEFEIYLLNTGLSLVVKEMKKEIQTTIDSGKNPMMTDSFVDMVESQIKNKLGI